MLNPCSRPAEEVRVRWDYRRLRQSSSACLIATILLTAVIVAAGWTFAAGWGAIALTPLTIAIWTGLWLQLRRADRERASHEAQLEHLAGHDPLTDLANRSVLEDRISVALAEATATRTKTAVVLIDLDRFREINEAFGRRVGDRVLQIVSDRLRSAARDVDTVARLGGDEFAAVLPGVERAEVAAAIAERFLALVEKPIELDSITVHAGASAGIALYPEHGETTESLIRHAAHALREAKAHRRSTRFYRGVLDLEERQFPVACELRRALEADELEVHFQPIGEIATRRITALEALVRWRHPTQGLLAPEHFLDAARNAGLMTPLTLRVLGTALRECGRWHQAGFMVGVAVNVSPRSLSDSRLAEGVIALLASSSVAPRWLSLELSEASVPTGFGERIELIDRLADMGVEVVVDDYGTVNTALSHLKELSVKGLKIDRRFVAGALTDRHDRVIMQATIELGHQLGLVVAAQGVETEAMWDMVCAEGCDRAQGFFVSRPMTGTEVLEWFQSQGERGPQAGGGLSSE